MMKNNTGIIPVWCGAALRKSMAIFFYLVPALVLLNGCMEDFQKSPLEVELEGTPVLLQHIESKGDYLNTDNAPSYISAATLQSNPASYVVLDIRSQQVYREGHIEGAVNLANTELLDYILENPSPGKEFVVVSRTGQRAGYYTALLRLYGISNVRSLDYGMGAWHRNFAGEWYENIGVDVEEYWLQKTDIIKDYIQPLPEMDEALAGLPVGQAYETLIRSLLEEDFIIDREQITSTGITMYFEQLYELDDRNDAFHEKILTMCYGPREIYMSEADTSVFEGHPGHIPGAVHYKPPNFSDLRSISFLQSLPPDTPIVIYSEDGQRSAYLTAYLRLLGYDARSMIFGINYFIYQDMLTEPQLRRYAFTSLNVNNFPYITGGSPNAP